MLPKDMWELLLNYKIHIIACGDNFQIPPILADQDNHLLDNPHIQLTEIMRQAKDSGIITLSTLIREGKDYRNFKSDDAMVLDMSEVNTGMLEWADIILCATNRMRQFLNTTIRVNRGYNEPLVDGEKVICNHNYWETRSAEDLGLTNGLIGTIEINKQLNYSYPYYLKVPSNKLECTDVNITTDFNDSFSNIVLDNKQFINGTPSLTNQQIYKLKRSKKRNLRDQIPYDFDYGYAITTWKAQGSQWNKVLVFEENHPRDKIEHLKFLYTSITRAVDKVVLIKK